MAQRNMGGVRGLPAGVHVKSGFIFLYFFSLEVWHIKILA